jgi:hypothetical protein
MEYIIAIPSYNRAKEVQAKTLKCLRECGIDDDKITVFVANTEQEQLYKNAGVMHRMVVGKIGLVPQREFICNYYPEGQYIVSLDDDVERVDLSLTPYTTLDLFFRYAFEKTKELGGYIWGVYPVFNPFFRKPREEISTCLNYIVGAFYGIINRTENNNLTLTITAENSQKEDVERSIRYFIEDGIVIRFNKIGFITKYYGKSGGLGIFEDRLIPMANASQLLKNTFPEYGNIFIKKNGMTEFRLKKIKAREVRSSTSLEDNVASPDLVS